MIRRPCYRNLDRPIVALWGLEPSDLFVILVGAGVLMAVTNVAIGIVGGIFLGLGYKAIKAGKPRGYVFTLFYKSGLVRLFPEGLRPPYLVLPPTPGSPKSLRFSATPGPEDDDSPESRFFRGGKEFIR